MPIYEFECARCGRRFEELLASAECRVRCPDCSSRRVVRVFSGFTVRGASRPSGSGCSACTSKSCAHCR